LSGELEYRARFIGERLGEHQTRLTALLETARWAIEALKNPRFLGREIPGWGSWPDVEAMCKQALQAAAVKRTIVAACTRAAEADPDSPAGVLALAVLDSMCTEWEHPDKPFVPDWTISPGVLLVAEAVKAREWTPGDLAERSGLDVATVRGVLDGSTRIDRAAAEGLARAIGTSAEMWLNAQRIYDAAILRGAKDTGEVDSEEGITS
jgi:plasmid maintenance system antidote protein VapI